MNLSRHCVEQTIVTASFEKKIYKNFGIVGRSVGIVQYGDLGNVHEKED